MMQFDGVAMATWLRSHHVLRLSACSREMQSGGYSAVLQVVFQVDDSIAGNAQTLS